MTTRATVTILTPADRQKVCEWAMKTGEGTVVTFRKKSRSSEQSAKMWAMLHEVAEQVVWYGQKLDAEAWKDVLTASLRHARVVPGIDKGTFVPLGMHTSTMTIEEMGNLIELIYSFGAEHDVVFKDPKPNEQQNTVNDPPPSSTVAAESILADEAGTDDTPMSDVPASNPIYTGLEWLRSVTKHIYRHTYPTDDKSDLEDTVKEAAAIYPKPDYMDPEYSEKAKLVVKECRKIRDKQVTMFDGEEIIAALVEMKPEELGL